MTQVVIFTSFTSICLGCFVANPGWPAATITIAAMIILGFLIWTYTDEEYLVQVPPEGKDLTELKTQVDKLAGELQRINSQSNLIAAFSPRK